MKTRSPMITLALAALTLAAADAQGCGESMFRTGQGMRYHTYITRQPADILIYRPEGDSASRKQLYAGLQKAGHKVTLVTDSTALIQALGAKHFDVVIAEAHDLDAVAAQLGKSKGDPALVAVLGPDVERDPAVRERYPRAVRESDGLNQYLKSIEQSMQTRGT